MAKNNLSLFLNNENKFYLENQPITEPGSDEVLVEIHTVGICGTDLHFWHGGGIGDHKITKPHVLGHETSGTIVKTGKNVTNLKIGDRVCLEPAISCFKCFPCRSGDYNLCQQAVCQSHPPYNGHLCKYFTHPAEFAYKLPDNVSIEEGSMVEPLACAIWACKRAKVGMGKKIFICGSGSIGLLCLLVSKAIGSSTIIMADVKPGRIESAKKLGADKVILVESRDSQVLAKQVVEVLGCQPDITLDCSGTEAGIQAGIYATAAGGLVEMVGLPPKNANIPVLQAVLKELDVIGCLRFVHCFHIALDLMSSGKVDIKPLMTHRFKLQEAEKAFHTALSGVEGSIKVALAPIDS